MAAASAAGARDAPPAVAGAAARGCRTRLRRGSPTTRWRACSRRVPSPTSARMRWTGSAPLERHRRPGLGLCRHARREPRSGASVSTGGRAASKSATGSPADIGDCGLMSEAVSAALVWYFAAVPDGVVHSGVLSDNAASMRLQQKLGFAVVGLGEVVLARPQSAATGGSRPGSRRRRSGRFRQPRLRPTGTRSEPAAASRGASMKETDMPRTGQPLPHRSQPAAAASGMPDQSGSRWAARPPSRAPVESPVRRAADCIGPRRRLEFL